MRHVAMGHEGVQIAGWLNAQGIPAFVLDYRVKPYHYPAEIEDGQRAMRLIRAHAAEYGIDPQRLGVWGFSAGGHLASTLGTHCDADAVPVEKPDAVDEQSCRPDFMVLAYPVISMTLPEAHAGSRMNLLGPVVNPELERRYSNQFAVTAETPMTFLFATTRDPTVPVENTLDFYRALERAKVPAETAHLRLLEPWVRAVRVDSAAVDVADAAAELAGAAGVGAVDGAAAAAPEPNLPMWIPGLTGPGGVVDGITSL